MGGNGAREAFLAKTLDNYTGVRFDEIGRIDDIKVITASNQKNTAVPTEAFTSKMYYVADPKTGRIDHIAFYDKKGNIIHSIDLEFNKDGSLKPFRKFFRKGKWRTEGTHFHKEYKIDDKGNKYRSPHNGENIDAVNRYYMRFVNKALKYNTEL